MLFGNGIGHSYAEFNPVNFLGIAHALHVHGIVRMIIYCSHCSEFFEAFYEHTLVVEVGKAHGTDNLSHALLTAPCLDSCKKLVDNLFIINKFHPAETQLLFAGLFVGCMVDNTGDCTYRLTIAECHERLRVAELPCGICLGAQSVDVVTYQRRHIAVIAFVVVYTKLHILAQLVGVGRYGVYVNR